MPENVGREIMAGATPMQFPQVGNRRMHRMAINPMDKCTIVSIFPKEIEEVKWTIEQGKFIIPGGTTEKPGVLVIGQHRWWKDIDAAQPLVEIPVGSMTLADSIVKDYCNSMIGCNMADAMPGLFFVYGEETSFTILTKYKSALDSANAKQMKWYEILVKIADALWSRTNGNPLAIMDEARIAARALNMNEKPWLKDFQTVQQVRCKACGSLKQPSYPVCPTCKAIDMDNPLAKDLKFAV